MRRSLLSSPAAVLVLALALDALVGDPETRWHPVAVFGRVADSLLGRAPRAGGPSQLRFGAASGASLVVGAAVVGGLAPRVLGLLGAPVGAIGSVALLKASFAYRALERQALSVADSLDRERLTEAQAELRALVSRDTSSLDGPLAASAAIESTAENLCDSFVAPLLYYTFMGLPAALAYRAVNTLDAMVGYHGPYEHLGKFAARADDVANLLPARLTAFLIAAGAILAGADGGRAWEMALRDNGRTESPNAGWPMAAMAGALGVQLEKRGHYRLGAELRLPGPGDVRRGVMVARAAAALAVALAFAGLWCAQGRGERRASRSAG